ncbi:MAG: hypothetical protein J3K34DRAFT_399619 [Monoraphidium minutum]|nr:MAG: hypothetical protein J3K34DRAFT_399619 [Monoraphidium minutum]
MGVRRGCWCATCVADQNRGTAGRARAPWAGTGERRNAGSGRWPRLCCMSTRQPRWGAWGRGRAACTPRRLLSSGGSSQCQRNACQRNARCHRKHLLGTQEARQGMREAGRIPREGDRGPTHTGQNMGHRKGGGEAARGRRRHPQALCTGAAPGDVGGGGAVGAVAARGAAQASAPACAGRRQPAPAAPRGAGGN